MAEEVIVELPEIYKVQAFQYANQDDYLNKMYGTDGKITNREKRRAKKYWMSDKRITDYDNHNSLEKSKFYQSMSDFIKAAQRRQAGPAVVVSNESTVRPEDANDEVAAVRPEVDRPEAETPMTEQEKMALANSAKYMQTYVDGLIAKYGAEPVVNKPELVEKSVTEVVNETPREDATLVTKTPIVTTDKLINHKNFKRNHHGTEKVTIGGKQYQVFVTKNLKNNDLGLVNDWSYAFDPETGKMIQLKEDIQGQVVNNGQGSYRMNPEFLEGAKWIDISSMFTPNANGSVSKKQFMGSSHFRPHKGGTTHVTIDGTSYPVMVTTGLLGNDFGLENDRTYAYDETNGKIKLLHEGMFGNVVKGGKYGHTGKWADGADWIDLKVLPEFKKMGGNIHKVQYFKNGNTMQQQDVKQKVKDLVQLAIQQGPEAEQANQLIQSIFKKAEQGDPQSAQLAQLIQAELQQVQGQTAYAKFGSKLDYIRSLKYAKGGKACPACEAKQQMIEQQACGGKAKKAKKRYFGGWL